MLTSMTALGQAGFLFRHAGTRLVVDPYLSNLVAENDSNQKGRWTRLFAPPIHPRDLRASIALITHAHDDHCDRETLTQLAANSPGCVFCGPYPVESQLREWNLGDRITPIRLNTWTTLSGISLMAIAAAHEEFDVDDFGAPAYFGFVLRLGAYTVYHAGDSIVWPGLADHLRQVDIDMALLPVNGRDDTRTRSGIIGNMNALEAMRLANDIGATQVVPIHNDLFAINQVPWSDVYQAAKELQPSARLVRMSPGQTIELTRPSRAVSPAHSASRQ